MNIFNGKNKYIKTNMFIKQLNVFCSNYNVLPWFYILKHYINHCFRTA